MTQIPIRSMLRCMSRQENLFPLKLLVISLGALLLGGAALLAGVAYDRAGRSCDAAQLRVSGQIKSIHPQGREVKLWLQTGPETSEILTLDACTGKEKGRITVRAE